MDVVSRATRSRMMAGIGPRHTKPERVVRHALTRAGFRYRLHRKDLPGAPDVVLPGRRLAIFVHGCFWHRHAGCRLAKLPSTNREFWATKLERNAERDRRAVEALLSNGWRVLTVWECATRVARDDELGPLLQDLIAGDCRQGELRERLPTAGPAPEGSCGTRLEVVGGDGEDD